MNNLEDALNRVELVRDIIKSNLFKHEQIILLSGWLGFNDTAYRDKSPTDKLNDFLLDKNYWIMRFSKKTESTESVNRQRLQALLTDPLKGYLLKGKDKKVVNLLDAKDSQIAELERRLTHVETKLT